MNDEQKIKQSGIFNEITDGVMVERIKGGIVFNWTRKYVGFGQLTMTVKHGKLTVDAEGMDDEFCAQVVKQAIREARERKTNLLEKQQEQEQQQQ